MWGTAILEVEPYTNNIVWEWHIWDNMVQERGVNYGATYGNVEDHPELININHNSISEKNELPSTESQEVNEDPRRKRRRSSASS